MVAFAAAPGGGERNHPPRSKDDLTADRTWLVELMQDINFGRIEGLVVESGQLRIDPPPRISREIKFGGQNGPRPESELTDFLLKEQVVDLFDHLDRLENGTISSLEVKHGLPFRMIVEDEPAN